MVDNLTFSSEKNTDHCLDLFKNNNVISEFNRLLTDLISGKYHRPFSVTPILLTETQQQSALELQKISAQLQTLAKEVSQLEQEHCHLIEQWQFTTSSDNTTFFRHIPYDTWYNDMTACIDSIEHNLKNKQNNARSLTEAFNNHLTTVDQSCLLARAEKMGSLLGRLQIWIQDLLNTLVITFKATTRASQSLQHSPILGGTK